MPKSVHKLFLICALGWAAMIFYLSDIPGGDLPPVVFGMDKLFHAGVFGILGFLILGALGGTVRIPAISRAWLAVLLVIAYGVLDEFHQHFVPGRTPDVYDVVADAAGGILGVWLLYRLMRSRLIFRADRPEPAAPD